jgi:hypothetical protein
VRMAIRGEVVVMAAVILPRRAAADRLRLGAEGFRSTTGATMAVC